LRDACSYVVGIATLAITWQLARRSDGGGICAQLARPGSAVMGCLFGWL
jgi:hypothetical protein